MSVRYPVATSGPDGWPESAGSPGDESAAAETISHGPVAVGVGVTSVLAPHPASVSTTTASGTAIVRSDMTPPEVEGGIQIVTANGRGQGVARNCRLASARTSTGTATR